MFETNEFTIPSEVSNQSLSGLTLDSNLQQLALEDFQIDISCLGKELLLALETNPLLSGVIVTDDESFVGMISRRKFFEILSRQYGREIFLRRSIQSLYSSTNQQDLILPVQTLICDAAQQCLQRPSHLLYEPIVVEVEQNNYKLLDCHKLLVAQGQIYSLALTMLETGNAALNQANLQPVDQQQQRVRYVQQMERVQAAAALLAGSNKNTTQKEELSQLLKEIDGLNQELEEIKQEKADLELLLETTTDHSSFMEAELQDEAEEVRRESEEQFKAIAEATPVPVIISQPGEGKILYGNGAASNVLCLKIEDLLNYSTSDFYWNLADREKLVEMYEQTGLVQSHELRLRRANGLIFWASVSLRPLRYRGETTILTALHDITDRKRAEESLQEAKEQLEAVLDAVPGSIAWISSEGYYLGVNKYMAESLNLTPEDFTNKGIGFLNISPDFTEFIGQFIAGSQKAGSHTIEVNVNGTRSYYLIIAQKYQQGRSIVSFGLNITERKLAEEALRENEERFRSLIFNLPGAIYRCRCDASWTMEFISDAIGEISGYPATDFINNQNCTYSSIIEPEDRESVALTIRTALQKQQPFILEYRIRHQDGSIRWVYEKGRGSFDEEGNLLYLDGAIFDISDRKQTQEALRIAEENYRSIFENALEGIFQSTPDGRYLSVNPAMANIYGYNSPQEMIVSITAIGQEIYVDSNCREKFQALMAENDEVQGFEYQVYRQDGSVIWVEENTRSVRDTSGKLLYYEGIIQNISKRKQEEAVLKQQLAELKIEIDQQK
ncbi:MAG: PAS domain S-box protein [Spirulinaceae cyanobacterium]